jgi:hypothetical protein
MSMHFTGKALFVIAATTVVAAQAPSVRETVLHGRRAFTLENSQMQLSTLPGGGFIGEIRFKGDDPRKNINVMRVPHYQTIDPYTYDMARDGDKYGRGIQRRLMSGYMGHFLTFPHWAASSPAELAQDYGQHGEAIAVEWKAQRFDVVDGKSTLVYGADLPKTEFRVQRTITLPADETVAYFEESVENLTAFGRPVEWGQHITFGPPFVALGRNFVDASVSKIVARGPNAGGLDTWPVMTDAQGNTRDLRAYSGSGSTWLMDGSKPHVWFTMYNSDYHVLIGYIFESAPNRWVLDWQENQRVQEVPWDGKVVARAICIGDSVVSGLRQAVQRGSQLDTPTFSWIDARERRTQSYTMFLAEIPDGFRGTADLKIQPGRITIVERGTGTEISLKASGLR